MFHYNAIVSVSYILFGEQITLRLIEYNSDYFDIIITIKIIEVLINLMSRGQSLLILNRHLFNYLTVIIQNRHKCLITYIYHID